jgi:hypothetical protein
MTVKKFIKGFLLFIFVAGVCIGARILISGNDPDKPTGMGAHPSRP